MGTISVAGPGVGAGLASRAAALGVDVGVIAASAGVGWVVRRRVRSLSPVQTDVLALGTLVAPTVVAFAVMEASPRQATPGKAVVSLRVQSVHGQRLTLVHAVARNLAKVAPWQLAHTAVFRMAAGSQQARWPVLAVVAQLMVLASAVTLLCNSDHRCWHDLLTRTSVVAVPRSG